jgi:large subunit ribosomal protein LP0
VPTTARAGTLLRPPSLPPKSPRPHPCPSCPPQPPHNPPPPPNPPVFTKTDLSSVKDEIAKYKVGAPARVGLLAPNDVSIPAGGTGMDPSQTSFFQALNIATKINKGTIEIVNEVHLIKAGDKVGASEAALLGKLGIKPFKYGLEIFKVYEGGALFDAAVLNITDEVLMGAAAAAIANVAALSLEANYPTLASIPHSVVNGYKNVLAIAVETDYSFPLADKVKEYLKNPSAFAVAAAPAAGGAAAAAPAKKEEPEEEEEEDMGFSLVRRRGGGGGGGGWGGGGGGGLCGAGGGRAAAARPPAAALRLCAPPPRPTWQHSRAPSPSPLAHPLPSTHSSVRFAAGGAAAGLGCSGPLGRGEQAAGSSRLPPAGARRAAGPLPRRAPPRPPPPRPPRPAQTKRRPRRRSPRPRCAPASSMVAAPSGWRLCARWRAACGLPCNPASTREIHARNRGDEGVAEGLGGAGRGRAVRGGAARGNGPDAAAALPCAPPPLRFKSGGGAGHLPSGGRPCISVTAPALTRHGAARPPPASRRAKAAAGSRFPGPARAQRASKHAWD